MKNNNIQVGERIKQIRLSLGESMEQFGHRFNTSKGTVNNWEKGRNLPNKENLKKISELGKNTVTELLYGNLDNLIQSKLEDFDLYKQLDDTQQKKIISLAKRQITDFPHLLGNSFEDELTEKIFDIVIDVVNGLDGTNESALRMSYEAFDFSEIENMFYKTITIDETEICYNYHLMTYQKRYKTKKILRDGMNEQLYQKLKLVHKHAESETTKIAQEFNYTLYNLDESKETTKNQILKLVNKIHSIVPEACRTKKVEKNIDVWVHNNIRKLIKSPESFSDLITNEEINEILLGKVEPKYIDMTKLYEPDNR